MRLIDASTIIDNLNREIEIAENKNYFNSKQIELKAAILKMARVYIRKQPTIDAVPVVRCKDCVFFESGIRCALRNEQTGYNDYCSKGRRKDG